MSLYHEAADILSTSSQEGGSLKSRVFKRKNIKSTPNQLYALVFETCKWSAILKEVIEGADILKFERKVGGFWYYAMQLIKIALILCKAYSDIGLAAGSRLVDCQRGHCTATKPRTEV